MVLKEIPELRELSYHSLYYTLRIGEFFNGSTIHISYDTLLHDKEQIPVLKNVSEYFDLLKDHPEVKPKKIIFDNPFTASFLTMKFPDSVKDVDIEININGQGRSLKTMFMFCNLVEQKPVPVKSYVYNNIGCIPPKIALPLYEGLEKVTVPATLEFEMFNPEKIVGYPVIGFAKAIFPNLKSLSFMRRISPTEVNRFPKQLKKLSCHIWISNDPIAKDIILPPHRRSVNKNQDKKKQLLDVKFPENLQELEILADDDNPLAESIIDISNLSKLRKFKISSPLQAKGHCTLKLPSGLKELYCESGTFMADTLDVMCPNLQILEIDENDIKFEQLADIVRHLPSYLGCLKIPLKAFKMLDNKATAKNQDTDNRGMLGKAISGVSSYVFGSPGTTTEPTSDVQWKLPEGLRELEIVGNGESNENTVLDFELNKLTNLDKLTISKGKKLKIIGDFPENLTELSLGDVDSSNLSKVYKLSKLHDLQVEGPIGTDDFNIDLPDSLIILMLFNCKLKQVHVTAPNVRNLVTFGNNFSDMNSKTFVVPDSIKKLWLTQSGITKISIELPPNLEKMSLSANDIYYVDNLPKNLRQLDLILTGLGSNNKASNFPEGLEKLDISGNAIDGEWLKRLNIKQLPNLKDLSIRDNQAILLDPRDLPPSLAVLDINGGFYASIESDFKCLPNLEQADFTANHVNSYFELFADSKKEIFGDKINFVSVRDPGISKKTVIALMNELNPKKGYVDVPQRLLDTMEMRTSILRVGSLGKNGPFD
ncbi:MAG: hypothetical protein M5E90_00680 [Asgard group archaeon]|nr:hypothetical protein [Asgard group archaeon]